LFHTGLSEADLTQVTDADESINEAAASLSGTGLSEADLTQATMLVCLFKGRRSQTNK
jgi:uncharacterized protein YjbI with pentapeptide repeats